MSTSEALSIIVIGFLLFSSLYNAINVRLKLRYLQNKKEELINVQTNDSGRLFVSDEDQTLYDADVLGKFEYIEKEIKRLNKRITPNDTLLLGMMMVLFVFLIMIVFFRPDNANLSLEETTQERITEIQDALSSIDELAVEVEEMAELAIEAEQRASDAIAISQLTEEQVNALDRRLNRDQTTRDVIFLIMGAMLGVLMERAYIVLSNFLRKQLDLDDTEPEKSV